MPPTFAEATAGKLARLALGDAAAPRLYNNDEPMTQGTRYRELDALRGISVTMMVLYHLLFDLSYFYAWNIPVQEGAWLIFARATATVFLLLVGVCFAISWERARYAVETCRWHVSRSETRPRRVSTVSSPFSIRYRKYLRRGLTIFLGGMFISVVTYPFAPEAYVKFGILHLIGISTILLPFFAPLRHGNIIVVFLVFFAFLALPPTSSFPFLFPLGIPYEGFASLDYYPLLPWFGVILIGLTIGNMLYLPQRHPSLKLPANIPYSPPLLFLGRRALWIYFLHQPLLLFALTLLLGKPTVL